MTFYSEQVKWAICLSATTLICHCLRQYLDINDLRKRLKCNTLFKVHWENSFISIKLILHVSEVWGKTVYLLFYRVVVSLFDLIAFDDQLIVEWDRSVYTTCLYGNGHVFIGVFGVLVLVSCFNSSIKFEDLYQ